MGRVSSSLAERATLRRRAAASALPVLALASLFAASPAEAKNQAGHLRVSVTRQYEPVVSSLCGYSLSYEQRMVVDGRVTMMPVSSVVPVGHYAAFLYDTTCPGYDIFAFGTCACYFLFVETS
jgi:hypothetical protein